MMKNVNMEQLLFDLAHPHFLSGTQHADDCPTFTAVQQRPSDGYTSGCLRAAGPPSPAAPPRTSPMPVR